MNMVYQDRWYQTEAVDATFDYFAANGGIDPETGGPRKANPIIALPTGTGKSLVIGRTAKRAISEYPLTRLIMATHVKELIDQNARKLLDIWPTAPLGVFSAGLRSRDFIQPIIYGGVKSMVGKLDDNGRSVLGHRDLLLIDEAHLVSPSVDTQYVQLIMELLAINPWLKVIGYTATNYRLGLGHLTNGPIFSHTCYDLTGIDGFARLLADGFLSPIFPQKTGVELDVSGVGMNGGEFIAGQLAAAVDKYEDTLACLKDFVQHGYNRRSWLLFAASIEHAEHIGEMLNGYFGVPTGVVHSKMKDGERDRVIKEFKRGNLRAIVNKDILTTGFDYPPIDYIGMLRPTMSTGLWVQMLGRATRPWLGGWLDIGDGEKIYIPWVKQDAIVRDYAGNTRRLGPINDPVIPKPKGKGAPGDAPVRICHECGTYVHASKRECPVCGAEFDFSPDLTKNASTDELIRSNLPQVEYFNVVHVVYDKHVSRAMKNKYPDHDPSVLPFQIKIAYYCEGMRTFYEYKTVEDTGDGNNFARKRGRDWFRQRYPGEPPETNAEVLVVVSQLRKPARIRVWINKKYPEVLGYEF
ncbi:DNA helicase [Sphingomonas phage Kimi]|nr:DNA helicase [Sphingomonas phage Kimi]